MFGQPLIFVSRRNVLTSSSFSSSNRYYLFILLAGTPYTAAEALLMLLESSPQPLVSPLEEECLYAESFDKCCEWIRVLPGPKKNVFLYICMFLHELLKYHQFNRLDADKLGEINRICFQIISIWSSWNFLPLQPQYLAE